MSELISTQQRAEAGRGGQRWAALVKGAATRRSVAALGGALVVALAAQVALPLSGTPVPFTLQVPAVLLVGGLLGPRLGAASMALYLALGVAGLPVFAPVGAPGLWRLLGATGGYLLAYPLAAAVTGGLVGSNWSWLRLGGALLAGLAVVHLGGVAQLAVVTGDPGAAVRLGSLPFLPFDLFKLLLVGLVLRRFTPTFRARL
jgi:biotin transport system substrate-specific component